MTDLFLSSEGISDDEFQFIKDLIYKEAGIFLAPHKKIMVQSRLNQRIRANAMSGISEYVARLRSDSEFLRTEIPEIVNRLTTNKTDFFRENHHFEFLTSTLLPGAAERARVTGTKILRIWSSACSTGEEPYSIAITLSEFFGSDLGNWDIKILSSDIDTNVIETGKKGVYRADKVEPVSANLRKKYFETQKDDKGNIVSYSVKPELKSLIEFKKINLLDATYPIRDKQDCIFCRNVVIYFDRATQSKIFGNFEKVLKERGILILGHSETLFGISDSYKFLGHTIYQKKPQI